MKEIKLANLIESGHITTPADLLKECAKMGAGQAVYDGLMDAYFNDNEAE